MPSLVNRLETLRWLRKNKQEIGLSRSDVSRLDDYLQDEWGIRLLGERDRLELIELLPEELRDDYYDLHQQLASCLESKRPVPTELDMKWYDLLAQEPLSGIVHSQKRPLIMGGIVWIASLLRHLKVDGSALDIGCHIGYQSIWLASHLGIRIDAVDRSAAAISCAEKKAKDVPNVEFKVFDYESDKLNDRKFDAVICSDAIPRNEDRFHAFLRTVSDVLKDQGVVILIDDLLYYTELLQRFASELKLGFGVCDVIGGFDGDSFVPKAALALLRGGLEPFPNDIENSFKEGWESSGFIEFANSDDVPPYQKSLAYFRAK